VAAGAGSGARRQGWRPAHPSWRQGLAAA
jgi:hypothetical protein